MQMFIGGITQKVLNTMRRPAAMVQNRAERCRNSFVPCNGLYNDPTIIVRRNAKRLSDAGMSIYAMIFDIFVYVLEFVG